MCQGGQFTLRYSTRFHPALSLLLTAALAVAAQGGEQLAPALEAEPSAEGLLTWWLYSPVQKDAAGAVTPPLGAREDGAVAGTNGKWALHIEPGPFVDFKPLLTAGAGTLWASARLESQTGGKRKLRCWTYCAVQVFIDGRPVLKKAQPTGVADDADAEIELPKGPCELTTGVTIRQGFCGLQLNLTEGRDQGGLPRRVPGDKIVIPTAAGKTPDTTAAALRALTFSSNELFVRAGDTVTLFAGLAGSIPVGLEPLSGRILAPDGKAVGAALAARPAAELTGRNIWRAQYALPADMGVSHAVSLEVKAGEKLLGARKFEVYSLAGLGTAAQALETETQQRAAQAKRRLPNAELAAEKLKLSVTKILTGGERITNDLGATMLELGAAARRYAQTEEQGRDPLEGQTGYLERAYISRIDEAPQPYFVGVPAAYTAGKTEKYPLVVFLHGYVPSYDKHKWWTEAADFNAQCDRNNAFLAIPFGRSNADFQSCGETDVLDVIAEVRRLYPIDGDRIYLYGYSMGGMAVYHLAGHHPDLFAAAIVMAGRADSPLQNKQPLAKFQPYKQWLIHVDNPISLCENFLNIPLRIYHGKSDYIISVDEARRMEARFKELGCNATLSVHPGDHFFGFDLMGTDEPLAGLLPFKRAAQPATSRMKAYSLRYAKQGPLAVTATTGDLKPIEAEWTLKNGVAEVTRISDNVLEYSLNGKVVKPLEAKGLRKTPGCCGPIREAICGPFLIAYGTSGSPAAKAHNKQNAERFAREWFEFTRSRAIIKADKDVSDAEKQSKTLFIIGEEQDNLLHAAAAAKGLPFSVKDGSVTIAGRKMPVAQTGVKGGGAADQDFGPAPAPLGTGFMYIYPSPFRGAGAETSIVICAGIWYGQEVGPNHKFDLLPDFILYNDQVDQDATSTNRALCAGFFNGEWKVDEKQMWWSEK